MTQITRMTATHAAHGFCLPQIDADDFLFLGSYLSPFTSCFLPLSIGRCPTLNATSPLGLPILSDF